MDTGAVTTIGRAEFRGRVYDSVADTIGATPLVRIHRLARDARAKADVLAKCEFFNGKTLVVVLPDLAERYLSTGSEAV